MKDMRGDTCMLKDAKGAGQMRQDSGEKRRLHCVTFENCVFTPPLAMTQENSTYLYKIRVEDGYCMLALRMF